MASKYLLGGYSAFAAMIAIGAGSAAFAQTSSESAEEVIITGSYIRGTPENTAQPVNVVTTSELERQGSPSFQDLIKNLPGSASAFGDSNQFTAGQSTGSGGVNLRGLGQFRTLVMMNGRRLVNGPAIGQGVDTNLLPAAAVGRIEVLKDGAAATYGSDAIGGVVNFLTRRDIDGLEVKGNFSAIDGSDGDWDAGVNWGWVGDRGNVLLSFGYKHRSELDARERDWATRPFGSFNANAIGGWSGFGNPGGYAAVVTPTGTPVAGAFSDPACVVGGTNVLGIDDLLSGTCRFQFAAFNNLVEEEDHYQYYAEANYDLTDSIEMHAEFLYAEHNVEGEGSSPSYGPVQGPGRLSSPLLFDPSLNRFLISENNPGLTPAVRAALPSSVAAALDPTTGTSNYIIVSGLQWRPLAWSGNDLFGGESKRDKRNFDGWRGSLSFNGELPLGIGWDAGVTYSENRSDISTPDIVVSRLQRALLGLGGSNCTTNTPGTNGCLWFNPFYSSADDNAAYGRANPFFSPAAANSLEVLDYIFDEYAYETTTSQFVADLVLNGTTPIALPGGEIGWAAGFQYRDQNVRRRVNDITNIDLNPCADPGVTTCTQRNGALSFFGPLNDFDLRLDNYAVFAEANFPILESLEAAFAVRYEDYGGATGSTTNPKVSLKFQPIQALAFRASAGTTFRAPPPTQLAPGSTTTLAFTASAVGYRPYDTFGNPNLKPETADTSNLGVILDVGPFKGTVDYFTYFFKDPIGTESGTQMVAAFFAGGGCGTFGTTSAFTQRFTFSDTNSNGVLDASECTGANLLRTRVNTINGLAQTIKGVDFSGELDISDMFKIDSFGLTLGGEGTYLDTFKSRGTVVEGVTVRPARNYAGLYDHNGFNSNPEWKGSGYLEFSTNKLNLRWTTRYLGELEDTRNCNYTASACIPLTHETAVIDRFITHDFTAKFDITDSTSLSASVLNVTDEDPPFAGTDLGYDPFSANPLGRVIRVGARQKF